MKKQSTVQTVARIATAACGLLVIGLAVLVGRGFELDRIMNITIIATLVCIAVMATTYQRRKT